MIPEEIMDGFGIDFGTTNSVAAVFNGRELVPFVDNDNKLPHPSVLWYRGSEKPVVGREAKDRIRDLSNTPGNCFIKSIKSQIEKEIGYEIFGEYYDTWKIASEIFSFLKKDAHRRYPEYSEIEKAVVTIPLSFNGKQRSSIRKAAEQANIFIKNFIHEPFAAVIGHLFSDFNSLENLKTARENILVFDWGGGTLDVTLVKLESGTISEISSRGCSGTSGDHFDELLMEDILNKFRQDNSISSQGFRVEAGIKSILSHDVEFAKIGLSDRNSVSFEIPCFYSSDGKTYPLESEINRSQFERLINLDVQDAMSLVDKVLHESLGLFHSRQ